MSACAVGLCTEDDRNAPAHDDLAWCAPTEVPVSATVLLDGGAMRGALTTTLPPGVDPTGVGDGPECVRLEDMLYSLVATLLLTLRSITPSTAVDCKSVTPPPLSLLLVGDVEPYFEEFPNSQPQELLPPYKSGLSPPALRVAVSLT
jgi:hypothetical protein